MRAAVAPAIVPGMTRSVARPAGRKSVVVAGGGVAGLEAVLALHALARNRVEIELLSPEHHFWYRPLAVAEPFGASPAHRFELAGLTSEVQADFAPEELARVDAPGHRIFTRHGVEIAYDHLVVACGATPHRAVPGALTFRGPADSERFRELLRELERGDVESVAFAVPGGAAWVLPLYELALMTSAHLQERGARREITLVTHEPEPLSLFGPAAARATRELLEEAGIRVLTNRYPVEATGTTLELIPDPPVHAERVVALPRLAGPAIEGLPNDAEGFVRTDPMSRALGLEDVYAAGDVVSFPVKQGGLAAQQADVAAEAIAARVGAPVEPRPFVPVLRGVLLTGGSPAYMRARLGGGHGEPSAVGPAPLWWPPGKVAGRYLAPFLHERGVPTVGAPHGIEVEVEV